MVTLLLTLTVLSMAVHGPAAAIDGRVVDGRSGNAIGGAEITIVGQRGSVRSDRAGRFRWSTRPPLPAEVIIVLPGGLVARPIRLTELDLAGELTLTVDRDVRSDVVTVFGASPTIDASPGSASTLRARCPRRSTWSQESARFRKVRAPFPRSAGWLVAGR
jgi:hypothetical protein